MTAPIGVQGIGPVVGPIERGGIPLEVTAEPGFGETLMRALGDVGELQDQKDDIIAAFLRGEPVELHQVMAAAEEASISLELLVEMRNKLTEAYRTIMNVQT